MTETAALPSGVAMRERRERLRLTRIEVAIEARVNPGWLAALESGYRPSKGEATGRVLAALDRLEAEQEAA